MSLKSKIKNSIPDSVLSPLLKAYGTVLAPLIKKREQRFLKSNREHQLQLVEKVRSKKNPIKVVFFALMDSVWKFDLLYRLMEQDRRFDPVILICPVVNYGRENMLSSMAKCYSMMSERGYKTLRSYNSEKDEYVDVRRDLNPDVIFYTNPYKGLIDDRYYITEFPDILTCYASYYFPESSDPIWYDQYLMNLVWKRYVETDWMIDFSRLHTKCHGVNCVNTSYPGFDTIVPSNIPKTDPWKIKDRNIKRILWAPHHTIANYNLVNYSTFLDYYDFMLDLAEKYKDKIQIAFKPHPILKNRLDIEWGSARTEEYYNRWKNLENGLLAEGPYEDLFLTSDAIMHDSGSFIAEYLVTEKPALYLWNGIPLETEFNKIAIDCLSNYYMARNRNDIENFIECVISQKDPKKEARIKYVRNTLLPKDGKNASENILNDLVKDLITY